VRWFGEDWGAPICRVSERTAVPAGARCYLCAEPIESFHTGVVLPFVGGPVSPLELAAHLPCFRRALGIERPAGSA
jgi:hypothetical protein